jgi:hypothetical protein
MSNRASMCVKLVNNLLIERLGELSHLFVIGTHGFLSYQSNGIDEPLGFADRLFLKKRVILLRSICSFNNSFVYTTL